MGVKNYYFTGDASEVIESFTSETIQCCVTSPPYFGLRDYGDDLQIGLEEKVEDYIENLVKVFRQVKRVLKNDGILWVNIGDSYAGSGKGPAGNIGKNSKSDPRNMYKIKKKPYVSENCKPKDLMGIPWMLAFALRADGWYLRQDIIWNKPNPMPESVTDRCTKSHEYLFMFTKSKKYYFDNEAIKEPSKTYDENVRDRDKGTLNKVPGRTEMKGLRRNNYKKKNKRSVWTINTSRYKKAHFATYPPELIEPCILAGSKINDFVLDPFGGSGTTSLVCKKNKRQGIYIDCNPEYLKLAKERCHD